MFELRLLLWAMGVQIRVRCMVVNRIMNGLTSVVIGSAGRVPFHLCTLHKPKSPCSPFVPRSLNEFHPSPLLHCHLSRSLFLVIQFAPSPQG